MSAVTPCVSRFLLLPVHRLLYLVIYRYKAAPLSQDRLSRWEKDVADPDLSLPLPNAFIPSNFSLVSEPKQVLDLPSLVLNDPGEQPSCFPLLSPPLFLCLSLPQPPSLFLPLPFSLPRPSCLFLSCATFQYVSATFLFCSLPHCLIRHESLVAI